MPDYKSILPQIDKRFYDTIWGESAGGDPDEIGATASLFLTRAIQEGYEEALKGSNAYRLQSPQYKKAMTGDMNFYERLKYAVNKGIIDDLLSNPQKIKPFYYMENVKQFGDPSWVKDTSGYEDIGRQRFYFKK